jgi:hypothetical protein
MFRFITRMIRIYLVGLFLGALYRHFGKSSSPRSSP